MAYALTPTTKAQLLDEHGDPVPEGATNIAIDPSGVVTFGVTDGVVYILGGAVGTASVSVTPNGGTAVAHDVTVEDDFDWTLGDPVPK